LSTTPATVVVAVAGSGGGFATRIGAAAGAFAVRAAAFWSGGSNNAISFISLRIS
jgi:hypothetical protein